MTPISRFEALAQRLVEGSLSRLLGGRLEPLEVATRIAQAIEDSRRHGRSTAEYQVGLHPEDHAALLAAEPALADVLAAYVSDLARQSGMVINAPLAIVVAPDPALRMRQISVIPSDREVEGQNTQVYTPVEDDHALQERLQALDAYLIVAGKRHIPLRQPQFNIGRRTDNDIVVEAPTVSRRHAQLRWRYGRFILYDLDSRGGTSVNGQPVTEAVLQPGDVIHLSDVPVIYGEGIAGREDARPADDGVGETRPFGVEMWPDDERPSS